MSKRTILFLSTALLIVASACSNSTSSDDHEHADAEGFRLKMNGSPIVEQLPGGTLTGEVELHPNEESDLISIYFLDDDGDEFQPDEDEYTLGYTISDETLIEFEQHDEDGKWSFHLHAEDSEGHADLVLKLMHGSHSDFTTQEIEIHVHDE